MLVGFQVLSLVTLWKCVKLFKEMKFCHLFEEDTMGSLINDANQKYRACYPKILPPPPLASGYGPACLQVMRRKHIHWCSIHIKGTSNVKCWYFIISTSIKTYKALKLIFYCRLF